MDTEILGTDMTATKRTHYTAPWTDFVRSDENYREVVARESLTANLKADGGMRIPGVVLPSKYNIDGKRVIWDGNSRHHSLEILSQDPKYNGSLDFLFIIMPENIADDIIRRKAWMLSLGSTNEQLKPREYAKGIREIVDLKQSELIPELIEKYKTERNEEPDDERLRIIHKNARKAAVEFTANLQGKSSATIFSILRVTESDDETVKQAVETGVIDVFLADSILSKSKNLKVDSNEIIDLALESAKQRGKSKITGKDLERVESVLDKSEKTKSLVESGQLPFNLIPELENIAENSKLEIDSLLSEALEFIDISDESDKVISLENINQAKEFLTRSAKELVNTDQEIEQETEQESEDIEPVQSNGKAAITFDQLKESKEKLVDFALFLSNLSVQEYQGLSDEFIVNISGKISKIQESVLKQQEKNSKKPE